VSVLKTIWRRRPLLALIVLILLLAAGYVGRAVANHDNEPSPTVSASSTTGSHGRSGSSGTSGTSGQMVALSSLPGEVAATVNLVQRHGPFPFAHDGIVYQNLEHDLPAEPRGYYHEYTVVTPGSSDRGERRIVTGRDGTWWYTADHYASFVRVDVNR